MKTVTAKSLRSVVASSRFFWIVVALFVFQASWIALSAAYPQAFDEQYHFGVTQLHAQHLLPFFASQPDNAGQYGALVRDPSMLFHYGLSFIYRFVSLFTDNQTLQVIILRFVNIGLAVWGLWLLRRLGRLVKVGDAKTNGLVLIVTLLPVYVLLASQISYDNLLIPVTTLTVIWAIELAQRNAKEKKFNWVLAVRLFSAMLLFSTIKFAYAPILFAITLYFLPALWRARKSALQDCRKAFRALSSTVRIAYLALLVISVWLFCGSIGYNIVKYHEPDPRCDKVITVEECLQFGPYARDHDSIVRKQHPPLDKVAGYPFKWTKNIVRETYFSVYSNFNEHGQVTYHGGSFVRQLVWLGWFWFGIALLAIVLNIRWLWSRIETRLMLITTVVYVLSVFYIDFKLFYDTTYLAAVHGRYIFPVLFLILLLTVFSLGHAIHQYGGLQKNRLRSALAALFVATIIGFTQGGGMLTQLYYGQSDYIWQDAPAVRTANDIATHVAKIVIL